METAERLHLRFRERNAFGKFCVALTEDRVPFTPVGFYTVVVHCSASELPSRSKELLNKFKSAGTADDSSRKPASPARVSAEAAIKAFWKIAKNL